MAYRIGNIPADAPDWLVAELRKIQEAQSSTAGITFDVLYVEPKKKFTGLTVFADGTSWKPNGVGAAGVWTYYGGTWNRLG